VGACFVRLEVNNLSQASADIEAYAIAHFNKVPRAEAGDPAAADARVPHATIFYRCKCAPLRCCCRLHFMQLKEPGTLK
jgi:hypothetical protein